LKNKSSLKWLITLDMMIITQEYYGKVAQKRVSEEIGRISKKLIG